MRERHFIICKICGNKKYINPAANRIYDKIECREKDPEYKAKIKQRQPQNRVELVCEGCGITYSVPPSVAYRKDGTIRKFHIRACKDKAQRNKPQSPITVAKRVKAVTGQKRTGKALQNINDTALKNFGTNPLNKPLPLPYKGYRGKDWSKKSRVARERDNYTCQLCGQTNRKKLVVDHIIDYGYCYNSEPYNLITLCRSCDRKQSGAHYIWNKYKLQMLLQQRYGYQYNFAYIGPIPYSFFEKFVFWSKYTVNIPVMEMQ